MNFDSSLFQILMYNDDTASYFKLCNHTVPQFYMLRVTHDLLCKGTKING